MEHGQVWLEVGVSQKTAFWSASGSFQGILVADGKLEHSVKQQLVWLPTRRFTADSRRGASAFLFGASVGRRLAAIRPTSECDDRVCTAMGARWKVVDGT
jgi:hypothetical protein